MNQELLRAVQDTEGWMKKFNRFDYFNAFKAYTSQYGPMWMKLLCGMEEDAMKAEAEGILDALAAGWAKQRIWNRSNARFADKQMLIGFFSPMLIGLEEPKCKQFAELLRDAWAKRLPKEAYEIASYKMIRAGFKNMILGLELKDKLLELEKEAEEAEKNQK